MVKPSDFMGPRQRKEAEGAQTANEEWFLQLRFHVYCCSCTARLLSRPMVFGLKFSNEILLFNWLVACRAWAVRRISALA